LHRQLDECGERKREMKRGFREELDAAKLEIGNLESKVADLLSGMAHSEDDSRMGRPSTPAECT
jgi:hypothetical protein